MTMIQREYTVRFLTPAFLGNAEQSGQWRTPPFKALLRQWWRVAVAKDFGYSHTQRNNDGLTMREVEGRLFGNAWLDHKENGKTVTDHCKSLVRMRLTQWGRGSMETLPGSDPLVMQPEVKDRNTQQSKPIGSSLYLGFGPISGNAIKNNGRAIDPDKDHATFSLAYPKEHDVALRKALWLMDRYGTLGGRSRNGWGSALFTEIRKADEAMYSGELAGCQRDWTQCLNEEWAHAIGCDETQPLIWRTAPKANWRELMKTLAQIKIGLRTQFSFTTGRNALRTEARHWLSYPVTNHSVDKWGNNARLPNTLRFRARPTDDGKSLIGIIFHVPCKPPSNFNPDIPAIKQVWKDVHSFLDELSKNAPRRYSATISNAAVIASLEAITLKRIVA